ncbi:hypothetical protein B4089_3726 [Bacillus licheniformis]|nr:hypothetical protein B4089_3613 [Bacillus licheniformis]OLF87256.1 hypothetical protein B4089_3726 [Bacillus licheniformis]
MEMFTDKVFTGSTVQEASQFISTNMELYQEKKELAFDMVYYEDAY